MMKKKRKSGKSKAGKKAARTSVSKGREKKAGLNPVGTWEEVAALVESNATELAAAVIGAGMMGQVAPVKFLFDVAKIQPPTETDEDRKRLEREHSLAETLLDRLNIPKDPVIADELAKDDEDMVNIPGWEKEPEDSPEEAEKEPEVAGVV